MALRSLFIALAWVAGPTLPATATPPNIVFIVADNQPASALGAYGNRDVESPHIDALAHRGVRFDRAYAASGMCSPTRATLLTGLMPSQHGLHNALSDPWVESREPGWNAVGEYRTVPATLAHRGYRTAMVGKWHLGDPTRPSLGFEHWVALPYGHTIDFWNNELVANGRRENVSGRHIVDELAERAVDYIESADRARPFFLQVNLDGPYALPPSNYGPARNRHYEAVASRTFESMPQLPVDDRILARLDGPFIEGQKLFELRSLSAVWDHLLYGTIRMQNDRESYANFVSQNQVVDDAVGRIVEAIAARGLAQRTVIVYTADQGNLYGQHGTWGHTIWLTPAHLYEHALRVPLIVVHPEGRSGGVSERLIGQYDIAPTLLALAEVEGVSFDGSPGRSFTDEIMGGANGAAAAQEVYFEQGESRGVRTERWAYWQRLKGFGECALFDMAADPEQEHNLCANGRILPEQREAKNRLDALLVSFFSRHSTPEHDLWASGVSKGMPAKPDMWLRHRPWDWAKKFWRDYVSDPEPAPRFEEVDQAER